MKTRYLAGLPWLSFMIKSQEVEAIVDTGFDGALVLPNDLIARLRLPQVGEAGYYLADGSGNDAPVFEMVFDWLGEPRRIKVLGTESDIPLIGMDLLRHARTLLDPCKGILRIRAS